MADVVFADNTAQVKKFLEREAVAFLHEAGQELLSQVKRNYSKTADSGETMNSWKVVVDESSMTATVGSAYENAIWEEFGTGEYAHNGKGRKGWWVYVKDGNKRSNNVKTYTEKEARRVVAIMRSKGLEAYMTKGKRPNYHMTKAFETTKPKIKNRLEQMVKGT